MNSLTLPSPTSGRGAIELLFPPASGRGAIELLFPPASGEERLNFYSLPQVERSD
jgi:hypothetical protein